MSFSREDIVLALKQVNEPEQGKDLISLDIVKDIRISRDKVSFAILLKQFNSPFKSSLRKACTNALQPVVGEGVEIEVDFTTKIDTKKVSFGRVDERKVLPEVKNIIAVASGKGGVGKSTISSNLAAALAKQGAKVGLIDADIFGPSQAKMFGVEDVKPEVRKINGKDRIVPVEKHGVKILSIAFFVAQDDALIWRGPMATSALRQFINDGLWGELDYLLIDLPPGTSDIHLTMVQELPVTGAVVVSTPQDVATADAIKGISMFRSKQINVPILGIIENMAWFTPEELPDNKYYIFGKGGVEKVAKKFDIPVLGQIPIVQSIREGGDLGAPAAIAGHDVQKEEFASLATLVSEKIEERNAKLDPTKVVEITNTDGCAASK
jgi:ATP-binding protein involved in chromosome partitioning